MFIKSWVRTLLIWVGLILCWLLNIGVIGYGEPYDVTVGDWIYTYQDPTPYFWYLYIWAIVFILTGCYIWTRLKNRHWAWMFFGLVAPIGLIPLWKMKDKSINEPVHDVNKEGK